MNEDSLLMIFRQTGPCCFGVSEKLKKRYMERYPITRVAKEIYKSGLTLGLNLVNAGGTVRACGYMYYICS